MFSFAFYDHKNDSVILARDKLGIKPLYFSLNEYGHIAFSSEMSNLSEFFNLKKLDEQEINNALLYNGQSMQSNIVKNLLQLKPGHYVEFSSSLKIKNKKYYTTTKQPISMNKKFETLMLEVLEDHLEADTAVDMFLSGGVDSSIIAFLTKNKLNKDIRHFSVSFDDQTYDEKNSFHTISQFLNLEPHIFKLKEDDLSDLVNESLNNMHSLVLDPSFVPTYFLCKNTANYTKAVISGDGADELFGGYNRYKFLPYIWDKFSLFPKPVRQLLAITVKNLRPMLSSSPLQHSHSNLNNKLNKLAFALYKSDNERDFFEKIQMTYNFNENPFLDTNEYRPSKDIDADLNTLDAMMLGDLKRYLPGDILCKVDRASMFHSLETRAPYLDRDLVEYAINIPNKYKVNDQGQKILLTNLLSKYLDRDLFQRPKSGFAIPLSSWLKGPLKSWVLDLLSPETVSRQGFFNVETIQKLSNQYFRNNSINTSTIWNLVIFQSWLNRNNF